MKRFGSSFLTMLGMLVILNGNVLARDICLKDNFDTTYVFRNVARLRPGGAIPLTGISFFEKTAEPLDGSAILNAAGTGTRVGIFVHGLANGSNNFTVEWRGDATFAGTGAFDGNGSFAADGTITLSAIDCAIDVRLWPAAMATSTWRSRSERSSFGAL